MFELHVHFLHDFTGNGYQDVVIGNVNGPIKVFFNKGLRKETNDKNEF